jgi:hypothetical protein
MARKGVIGGARIGAANDTAGVVRFVWRGKVCRDTVRVDWRRRRVPARREVAARDAVRQGRHGNDLGDVVEPLSIGIAIGTTCLGAGVVIGHFIALHGRVPGEHKVEIADLGEHDILVLTHESVISDEMAKRLKSQVTERLDTAGRFAMVISGGFRLSVIRRHGHPSTWSRTTQVASPAPTIDQDDKKPRKQARKS